MTRRFDYKRMSPADFRLALAAISMPPMAFGRIFGFDERRIKQWISGEQEVPIWVFPVMRILKNAPGAIIEARQAAAEMIRADNLRPELGEFPYLESEADDEQD